LRCRGYDNGYGLYKTGEQAFIRRLAEYKPRLCIDIGANQGLYAETLLNCKDAIVISFEPTPAAVEKLLLLKGRWADRLLAFNYAIGDTAGFFPIFCGTNEDDQTVATLSKGAENIGFIAERNTNEVVVQVKTFDQIFLENEYLFRVGQVDLLKIDVEQLLPFENGWRHVDVMRPENNIFQFSNFVFVSAELAQHVQNNGG
jgi:FkbM family methyltransferase